MADVFEASEAFVTQGFTALFLGSTPVAEKQSSPGGGRSRRRQSMAPGNRAQRPEMVIAAEAVGTASASALRAAAEAAAIAEAAAYRRAGGRGPPAFVARLSDEATSFYFEVFIKTTGGGLQPSGAVGVGVAFFEGRGSSTRDSNSTTETDAAPPQRYLHYHSSRGARGESFPRQPRPVSSSFASFGADGGGGSFAGGVPYGPSFSVGDTVGCGWEAEAGLYFTRNGRYLGVAWSPTALFRLLTQREQVHVCLFSVSTSLYIYIYLKLQSKSGSPYISTHIYIYTHIYLYIRIYMSGKVISFAPHFDPAVHIKVL